MSLDDNSKNLHSPLRDGYEVLDRYDTADPSSGDEKVIEHLLALGANLSLDRHVVHYMYFGDEMARSSAESKLVECGYETHHGVDSASSDRPKSLIAERIGIVNEEVLDDEREVLTAIAEAWNGEYDGWEASID